MTLITFGARVKITNLIIMSFSPVLSRVSSLLESHILLNALKLCHGLLQCQTV
jgi:hypothetical protein